MAKGKDERHNKNRQPLKPVTFSDVNDFLYGKPNRFGLSEQDVDLTEHKKVIDEDGNEAWSYMTDDERYDRNKDEPGALLPSQQTGY